MEQRYDDDDNDDDDDGDDGEKYIRNGGNEMAVTHDTKKWTRNICWNPLE